MAFVKKPTDTTEDNASQTAFEEVEEEVSHSTFLKQFSGHTARRVGEKIRAEDGGRFPDHMRAMKKKQHHNGVMISVHSPLFAFSFDPSTKNSSSASAASSSHNSHSTEDDNNKFWRWENQLNLNRDNLWEVLDWAQSQPGVRWCKQTLYQHRSEQTVHAADNRSWFAQIPWRESFLSDPMYHRLLDGRKEHSQPRTPKLKLVRPLRAKPHHQYMCMCCRPQTVNAVARFKPEQQVTHVVFAGLNLTSNYQLGFDGYCTCLLTSTEPSTSSYDFTIRTSRSAKPITLRSCRNAKVHKLPEEAHNCISIDAGGFIPGSLHGATEDTTDDEQFSGGTFRGPLRIYFGAIPSMNWAVNRMNHEQVRRKRKGKKFGGHVAGPREVSSRGLRRELKADITQDLSAFPIDSVTEIDENEETEEEEEYDGDDGYTVQGEANEFEEAAEDYCEDEDQDEEYGACEETEAAIDQEEKQAPEVTAELNMNEYQLATEMTRNASVESKHFTSSSNLIASNTPADKGASSPPIPPASPPIDGPARCLVAPASPLLPAANDHDTLSQVGSESSYDFVHDFDVDQAESREFDLV